MKLSQINPAGFPRLKKLGLSTKMTKPRNYVSITLNHQVHQSMSHNNSCRYQTKQWEKFTICSYVGQLIKHWSNSFKTILNCHRLTNKREKPTKLWLKRRSLNLIIWRLISVNRISTIKLGDERHQSKTNFKHWKTWRRLNNRLITKLPKYKTYWLVGLVHSDQQSPDKVHCHQNKMKTNCQR